MNNMNLIAYDNISIKTRFILDYLGYKANGIFKPSVLITKNDNNHKAWHL